MSSFVGHTLIGTALALRKNKLDSMRAFVQLGFLIGLAVSPDVDYLMGWLGYGSHIRWTHSLGYCLLVGMVAWVAKSFLLKNWLGNIPTQLVFAIPFSHLILDLLVAVHPMPLFWPLTTTTIVLPLGVLPSAGQINWLNYYFWRNLAIEMGILGPIAILIVPRTRAKLLGMNWIIQLFVWVSFISAIWIGLNLSR